MTTKEPVLVFFGMETAGRSLDSDIVQIYMKCSSRKINRYIRRSRKVQEISLFDHVKVSGLKLRGDKAEMRTCPLLVVLKDLLGFLKQFDRPCTLIAHRDCYTYSIRLIRAIKKLQLEESFKNVIAGFTDTQNLFVKKYPEDKKKPLSKSMAAKVANVNFVRSSELDGNVKNDTNLLQLLALHHFTPAELAAKRTFAQDVARLKRLEAPQKKISKPTQPKRKSGSKKKAKKLAQSLEKGDLQPDKIKPEKFVHYSQTRKDDPLIVKQLLSDNEKSKKFVQSSRKRKGDPFALFLPLSNITAGYQPSRMAKHSYFNNKL